MKLSRLLLAISIPVIFLALFITSLQTKASPNTTFTVNSTVDAVDVNPGDGVCETAVGNGVCTLRAAVMEANAIPGKDTIYLAAGNYLLSLLGEDEDSSTTGDLDIIEELSLIGTDRATTIIDGNQADRIFHILGVATYISDVTITNGSVNSSYDGGGGILNDYGLSDYFPGDLTLDRVNISNNKSIGGGGTGWNFSGGGILSRGPLTVTNSLIQGNETSNGLGGGIRAESTAYIQNSTVSDNVASVYGGGIAATSINLVGSTIDNNILKEGGYSSDGGGLYIISSSTIEDSIISNNSLYDGKGGGIFVGVNASVFITNTKFISNTADSNIGYTGTRGGGIYSESYKTITIVDSIVTGNYSEFDGGGIHNEPDFGSGQMLLDRVTISQNSAAHNGAGIHNSGALAIVNSTIASNFATDWGYTEGGGIYHDGISLSLTNSTVTRNEAQYGGGIYHYPYQSSGIVSLKNTILANNISSVVIVPGEPNTHNCAGPILSEGYNLEDGQDCKFSSIGDLSNVVAALFPDLTVDDALIYIPLPSSPAIDAGSNINCPENDQRLITRPIDGDNDGSVVCDIGSIEYEPAQDVFFSIYLPTILK